MLSSHVPTPDNLKDLQQRLALTEQEVAQMREKCLGADAKAAFGALAFARLVDLVSTEPELAFWFYAYVCSAAPCVDCNADKA
ncbi:MAG: hypothetical protein AB8B94_05995 [Hyphomicrobiales bacterium]